MKTPPVDPLDFPKLDECLLAWLGVGRWRVLGRRLRPLSLLHRELLRVAGCALVTGQGMSLTDLDLAVAICSRSPRAAARWLARRRGGWRARARMLWLALGYGWRMPRQWAVLRQWAQSCENAPEMMDRPVEPGRGVQRQSFAQDGAPLFRRDAPPLLEIWSRLTEAGFPWDAVAGEWPAGLARWLYETLMTRDGGRKFVTARDEEIMEEARRVREITQPKPEPEDAARARARVLMVSLRPSTAAAR